MDYDPFTAFAGRRNGYFAADLGSRQMQARLGPGSPSQTILAGNRGLKSARLCIEKRERILYALRVRSDSLTALLFQLEEYSAAFHTLL